MKCVGKTLQGKRCKNLVSGKNKYCYLHKKKYKYSFGKVGCRKKLSDKIRVNMDELKKGRWKSRAQAIAISYQQVKKRYPSCKKYFKRN